MATQKEAGVTKVIVDGKVDQVELAIRRLGVAMESLRLARLSERTARSSGDPEGIDDAVYERVKAEKECRDASRGEGIARAVRAAARAAAVKAR